MRWILGFILSLFIMCSLPSDTHAATVGFMGFEATFNNMTALNELQTNILEMTKEIHVASSSMMKFGHMLICNAVHGEASYWVIDIPMVPKITIHLICIDTWISGVVFYILGFFVMVMASFYLFDVAFNLSIGIVLLPIGLALWPFAWTRDKLKKVVEGILYYTGIFIFLPLGILIAIQILVEVVNSSFEKDGFDFATAYEEDKSDLLRDHLGVFSIGFLACLLCYIIALKIIPLMACEFCSHFFGGSLAGSPLQEKVQQAMNVAKEQTVGRVEKYAKDVAKHQAGNAIKDMGNKHGNFLQRTIARAGKNLAKTKK